MQSSAVQVRERRLDEIAEALPRRAAMLSKLFLAQLDIKISRTEIGVLRALSVKPHRITELGAKEGVTQPAATLVVNRLQERQWVRREHDSHDGRAVLVHLTDEGATVLQHLRDEYRTLMHQEMAALDDHQVEILADAVDILDGLISSFKERNL